MNRLNTENPIVDQTGRMTQVMRAFTLALSNNIPLVNAGTPEGAVDAPVYSFCIDSTGVAGSLLYIKMQEDIAGDKTKGWVAV